MAMTPCRECGANVSSQAAKCPHCGIDCPSATARQSQVSGKIIRNILAIVIIGGGVYSCATMFNNDSAGTYTPNPAATALVTCQQALRQVAKNPSSAEIPYANDTGSGGTHRFSWGAGDGLTMMNAFGAHLDTTATCTTSADGTQLTGLLVNGKIAL